MLNLKKKNTFKKLQNRHTDKYPETEWGYCRSLWKNSTTASVILLLYSSSINNKLISILQFRILSVLLCQQQSTMNQVSQRNAVFISERIRPMFERLGWINESMTHSKRPVLFLNVTLSLSYNMHLFLPYCSRNPKQFAQRFIFPNLSFAWR